MRKTVVAFMFATIVLGLVSTWSPSAQTQSSGVIPFAVLPVGAPGHPEGLTVDTQGNVYAASFELTEFAAPSASARNSLAAFAGFPPVRGRGPDLALEAPFRANYIYVWAPDGRMIAATPVPAFVVPLGMAVSGNNLYVNDVINGDILRYTLPLNDSSRPVRTYDLCGGFAVAFGAPGEFCAFNANDIGPDGRLYISDNGAGDAGLASGNNVFLNGRIFVLDPATGAAGVYLDVKELDVDLFGFPRFGVNGVAFGPDQSLYMANMSMDNIYRVRNTCGATCTALPSTLELFASRANGIDGPDNIDFDANGNLWVASGQTDQVVVINGRGRTTDRIGSFDGFNQDGVPLGLLQPSGIAYSNGFVYVGNEANITLRQPFDPINWNQLKAFTISKISAP